MCGALSARRYLDVACSRSIIRGLGPLRGGALTRYILHVPMSFTHLLILIVELAVVSSLLDVSRKSAQFCLILFLTLVRWRPLKLPPDRLERILLLLEHNLRSEFQLGLPAAVSL